MSDVVIVGAGPAGLALGCYLADAGVPCSILERVHHPRPHVGESLMPATVRVFREIGFLPVMEAADFPRSEGVVYHPLRGDPIALAYADFPQEGIDQAHTYHVDRSRFDLLLLKHAESLGCRLLQGAAVREVAFGEDGRAKGVHATFADQEVFIPARVVVDASGRATKVGRQLGLRRDHPVLDQFALHAWFVDVDRGRRPTEHYTHVFFLPDLRGWAWQAPINHDITSVGLVADKGLYQASGGDVYDFFAEGLEQSKPLSKAMRQASRINDLKGEVSYSYRLDRVCGDGWLAVGDAAVFIDPVFSSGVSVALHSARFAAERVLTALESRDFSRETFLPYETRVLAGATTWDELVRLFYRLLPAYTRVLESPEHRPGLLRLIQGEIDAEEAGDALAAMRDLVAEVEGSPAHELRGALQ